MTEGPGNHAIRSRDFRYIRYHNGAEELYADDDPWNHNNRAGDQRYADVLVQHRRHLPETEAPGIPARHQTIDDGAWKSGFGKQARPIQTYRPENGEKFVGESLAYSTDNGRTYHLLPDFNPILRHPTTRDSPCRSSCLSVLRPTEFAVTLTRWRN